MRLKDVDLKNCIGSTIDIKAGVRDFVEMTTKTGKKYLKFVMFDGNIKYDVRWFDVTEYALQNVDTFSNKVCNISCKIQEYMSQVSVIGDITEVLADDIDEYTTNLGEDSISGYYAEIENYCNSMNKNRILYKICSKALDMYKEKISYYPAAVSVHHAFKGGWVLHTVKMCRMADKIASIYNLDKDLLICGTLMHDMGKLEEYSTDTISTKVTGLGALIGHPVIGTHIVNYIVSKYCDINNMTDSDKEDVMLLNHMLLSHHGELQYGSPVVPKIPEAVVLHEIDMIDSRINMFSGVYDTMSAGETHKDYLIEAYKPKFSKGN